MKLEVEDAAGGFYKQAMGLVNGEAIRIYVRLGGCGSVHPGLSLGVTKDEPIQIGLQTVVDGITYYMEQDNLWYLDNKSLRISYDEQHEEIKMIVE
ncbi:HesB/YadR/YfhF family protein [Paenibacillus sp. 2TAB23]|uniref:HesB/YadR/YfhF family protein n=1 Tax=Paenibacillus sp. 2TAB23 TaxID=3233004 RepID=UPI003F9D6C00